MGLPKRRHSNMRSRLRRTHDTLHPSSLSKCAQCGAAILSHRICSECGYYGGKQVVTMKIKSKKEKKR